MVDNIQPVLKEIAAFQKSVEKAIHLRSRVHRDHWFEDAESHVKTLVALLGEPSTAAEFDRLLNDLAGRLAEPANDAISRQVIEKPKELAQFLRAEAQLHRFTHLKDRDYDSLVAIVAPLLGTEGKPEFPRNTQALLQWCETTLTAALVDGRRTAEIKPRANKGEVKSEFVNHVWRYTVGTLVTIANIYYSSQQLGFPWQVGTASITLGARLFSASSKKPPSGSASSRGVAA